MAWKTVPVREKPLPLPLRPPQVPRGTEILPFVTMLKAALRAT